MDLNAIYHLSHDNALRQYGSVYGPYVTEGETAVVRCRWDIDAMLGPLGPDTGVGLDIESAACPDFKIFKISRFSRFRDFKVSRFQDRASD